MAWQGKSSGQFHGNWFGLPGEANPNAIRAVLSGAGFLTAVLSFVTGPPVIVFPPSLSGWSPVRSAAWVEDAEEEEFMAVLAIALQVLFPKR